MRAGAHYLERYATSRENFRRVLERKTKRRLMLREEEADHSDLIEEVVARFEDLRFIDDRQFAEARLRSLRRKGTSTRMVAAKLSEKGVDRGVIEAVVSRDETSEEVAAFAYARRRRLGPFRLRQREERRDRDVAAMMRAGFAFGLAARIIDGRGEASPDDDRPGDLDLD